MAKLTKAEALAFFSTLYRGEHHLPSPMKNNGSGFAVRHYMDLASFDYDELTRLVFLAHERCVRVSISASGPRHIRITIHGRVHDVQQDMARHHPTLDEAVAKFRECGNTPWSRVLSEARKVAP